MRGVNYHLFIERLSHCVLIQPYPSITMKRTPRVRHTVAEGYDFVGKFIAITVHIGELMK